MRRTVLISDLHLTTNPLDYYKWDIFEWLMKIVEEHKIKVVNILGDLTERKDNHSSLLVNKLCSYLELLLYSGVEEIRILKGNHDFIDETTPFFEFLNVSPSIRFIVNPIRIDNEFFYPYSKEYDFEKYRNEIAKCDVMYMHTQLKGTELPNNRVLDEGITVDEIKNLPVKIYSGHIHFSKNYLYTVYPLSPWENLKFGYIGSPYPVYFGDGDKCGGVMLLDGYSNINDTIVYYDAPSRFNFKFVSVDECKEMLKLAALPKDQLKITYFLDKFEYDKWDSIKKETKELCANMKLELVSLSLKPKTKEVVKEEVERIVKRETYLETLERFSKKEKVDDIFLKAAMEIVNANSEA